MLLLQYPPQLVSNTSLPLHAAAEFLVAPAVPLLFLARALPVTYKTPWLRHLRC
jgi:hypothetical protein